MYDCHWGCLHHAKRFKKTERSDDYKKCCSYGVLSAVHAQAQGIASFIADDDDDEEEGPMQHVLSISCIDDASMWVADPATPAEKAASVKTEGMRIEGKLWRRGGTIHLPVCNQTEHLYVRRLYDVGGQSAEILRGLEVHSAASPLVEANASTIRHRMKSWQAVSASGSGDRIDPAGDVRAANQRLSGWRTVIHVKDNLGLNLCIMGMEEKIIKSAYDDGLVDEATMDTFLHWACAGHSVCLSAKNVTKRVHDLPPKYVRMGHLHESGKVAAEHIAVLKKHVKDNFVFDAVRELPDDFDKCQAIARHILTVSRPTRDLTPKEEDFILNIDNSDWQSDTWRHVCLGKKHCLVECGGKPNTALELMQTAAVLSVGRCAATPLAYRWKGVEAFACKTYRGKRQHKAWCHSHLALWPKHVTQRAQAQIEALAAAAAGTTKTNDQIFFKTKIRGGTPFKC